MEEAGLDSISEYTARRRKIIVDFVTSRPLYTL
jgi:hypothetical protein